VIIEESKQPVHETVEIRVGGGGAIDMTPDKNANLNDGVHEITKTITSTRQGLQPIDEVINEAISVTQRSNKPNEYRVEVTERQSRNSAGSKGSGKGSPRATDAAGF